MKTPAPKISTLVVSAIRNLREARGSTAKDIMNYIVAEHNAGDNAIQRRMNAALKRGVDYGILKQVNGHYSLNGDPFCINPQNMVPEDKTRRRKRKGRRVGRRRHGRRARGGKGRRRSKKTPMKAQRRAVLNRKRGMHVRRVKRQNNNRMQSYREEPAPRERTRPENTPADLRRADNRRADVEVPRRGSSIKGKERSRSRSRPPSQPRLSSRQPSRQESPAPSQSSTSSDHEEKYNRHDD
ncbi:histone H1-delta-like [Belonocnema kinseyi]|uniref:histone H1-delta-like n=1 Tax=Belonocnema kinseyi TaxID=2817044 RepID=UPI00143D5FE4|nr:histone H1-delta-like [Belonocnema kinseyi]